MRQLWWSPLQGSWLRADSIGQSGPLFCCLLLVSSLLAGGAKRRRGWQTGNRSAAVRVLAWVSCKYCWSTASRLAIAWPVGSRPNRYGSISTRLLCTCLVPPDDAWSRRAPEWFVLVPGSWRSSFSGSIGALVGCVASRGGSWWWMMASEDVVVSEEDADAHLYGGFSRFRSARAAAMVSSSLNTSTRALDVIHGFLVFACGVAMESMYKMYTTRAERVH